MSHGTPPVLGQQLITAHADVGLPLRSYFGPGSTANVMLGELGAKRVKVPQGMRRAVDCAFFGGRFEHSTVGVCK